jgi:hypothetical protein
MNLGVFLFFYGARTTQAFSYFQIPHTDPDPVPDPDPIRIQGFNDQNLKKKPAENFFYIFF